VESYDRRRPAVTVTKPPTEDARKIIDSRLASIAEAMSAVDDARQELEDALRRLADAGYSYRELGDLSGYTKQHAGDLVNASRARRA
jgi:plasmid stabilization system protein ParE